VQLSVSNLGLAIQLHARSIAKITSVNSSVNRYFAIYTAY